MNWLDHTRLHVVEPHEVNFSNDAFRIPNYSDSTALRESIRRMGILNRPVVQEHASDGIVTVLGRRRLQAAVDLGVREVQVLVVSADMPVSDGFILAFMDNAAHRSFDAASTAVIVKRLLGLFPIETVAREYLPVLGVPPIGPRLERLRRLGGLEERALKLLALGRISEKTAVVLTQMDPRNRSLLLDVLDNLGMNANKNAEIVEYLFDLSICEGRELSGLIQDGPFREVLADRDVPAPERARRFRDLVRARKFPELVEKEREFREWYAGLPLAPGTTVRPAQSFENGECTIEIRVSDRAAAGGVVEALSARFPK
ncbi:MAG: ParB N-terminal domain-containing protein [Pseudomonadota bacterium]